MKTEVEKRVLEHYGEVLWIIPSGFPNKYIVVREGPADLSVEHYDKEYVDNWEWH